MSYQLLADSDGKRHPVYSQAEEMSCALACLRMIEDRMESRTHTGGESRIKQISAQHPGSLLASQLEGENWGLGIGTHQENVARTFQTLGVRLTRIEGFDPTGDYKFFWNKSRIREGAPALIMLGWYQLQQGVRVRAGGHFILAARITSKGHVVVLDPFKGTLHELRGSNGVYLNHGLSGRIEILFYTG